MKDKEKKLFKARAAIFEYADSNKYKRNFLL